MKFPYQQLLRAVWLGGLLGISGCDTDGDACFGLCSKDDDRDPVIPGSSVDRSCYPDAALGTTESQDYADISNNSRATLLFQASSAASATDLRPLLIWITGDTWRIDNDADDAPSLARRLAEELGAHLARVNYREDSDTQWPEPIIDVNTAIRFLKLNASDLNIDTQRIILGGDQAGAHLAALAATASGITEFVGDENLSQDSSVNVLVAIGGLYDFATIIADAQAEETRCGVLPAIAGLPIRRLFDCAAPDPGTDALSTCDTNELQQASPVFHASSDDPIALIWHGALDCDFPVRQSERLHERLIDLSTADHQLNVLSDDDAALDSLVVGDMEAVIAEALPCEEI